MKFWAPISRLYSRNVYAGIWQPLIGCIYSHIVYAGIWCFICLPLIQPYCICGDALPMRQHARECAEQRLRARKEPDAVERWPNLPAAWQHATLSHSHTTPPSFSTSSDHVPLPPHQIAFKLSKNIGHGPYDGSPANQGTVKTHCLLHAAVRLMQGKGRDTEGGG